MAPTTAESSTAKPTGEVRFLPLELCDTSPDLRRRFDYEVDALAESIHANGQIHPGVAFKKPDGRFEIVVGFRRFFACKKSLELNGAPAVFLATVLDEVPSEKERHILALAENERERGQRQDLTVEEQVAYFGSLAKKFSEEEVLEIGTRAGKSAETVRRLLKLSSVMGEERVNDAYKIERAADFRFGLGHLEELSKIHDPKAFVEAAATTAVIKADPDEIEKDVLPVAKETCAGIPWLAEKFPELAWEKEEDGGEEAEEEGDDGGTSSTSVIPTCYFVVCPHKKCGAGSLVEFKAKGEITDDYLWGERGLEKGTTSADVELSGRRTCRWCGDEFFVSISREGNDKTVRIRATVRETTERVAAAKVTAVAEPCTVKRGSGEEWVLVTGGKKYLYGRDGKLRETKRVDEAKESDGRQGR